MIAEIVPKKVSFYWCYTLAEALSVGTTLNMKSACFVAGLFVCAASICMVALPVSAAEDSVVTKAGYEPLKPAGDMQMWFYDVARQFRYPVPAEFEFAYIDKTGKVLITAPFIQASSFRNGFAPVSMGKYIFEDGKWTLGDLSVHTGKLAMLSPDGTIKPLDITGTLPVFYDDLAMANVLVEEPGQKFYSSSRGLIDTNGKTVLKSKWRDTGEFSEGLFAVADEENAPVTVKSISDMGSRYSYADRTGAVVIPGPFSAAKRFSEGFAAVSNSKVGMLKGGKSDLRFYHDYDYHYIDKSGKTVIAGPFLEAMPFATGLAAVMDNTGKWGYVDKSGKMVIACQFDWAGDFSGDLAPVEKDLLVGFVDKSGKLAIQFKFKDAKEFSDGLAPATLDGRTWGFVDKTGEFVIKPTFQRAFPFSNDRALVYIDLRKDIKLSKSDLSGIVDSIYEMRAQNKFNEARAICLQIVQMDPNAAAAKTAKKHLDTGLVDHDIDDQAIAFYHQGMTYAAMDRLVEAKTLLDQAIKADPEVPMFYGALAYVYIEEKKYQEIIDILEKVLKKHPSYVRGYWRLSQAYQAIGKPELAAKAMTKAKELDPQDPYIKD